MEEPVELRGVAGELGRERGELERVTRERGIEVQPGDIVLIRCFDGEIGQPGWAECRGLSKDAAEWLRDRQAKTVGVDLGTVDDHTDLVRPADSVPNSVGEARSGG